MKQEKQLDLLDTIDLTKANEAVLVANTPSFLLDRLRKDAAVDYVSKSLKTPEILENLLFSVTRPINVRDIVWGYINLVALGMKDPNEVWPELDKLDLSGLEWGNQIRAQMKAEAVPTSSIDVKPRFGAMVSPAPAEAGNSSVSETLQPNPDGRTIFT
jgi:hypothetical protein